MFNADSELWLSLYNHRQEIAFCLKGESSYFRRIVNAISLNDAQITLFVHNMPFELWDEMHAAL